MRIKWPNDLYCGPLKLGGILCHSSFRDGRFYVTIGVGLNLSNRQPTTCVDALIEAAAAAAAAGEQQPGQQGQPQQAPPAPVARESLLAGILSRLEPALEVLAAQGFAPFEGEYCRHWLHSGQAVQLEEGDTRVAVTVQGLSPNGYLLVRRPPLRLEWLGTRAVCSGCGRPTPCLPPGPARPRELTAASAPPPLRHTQATDASGERYELHPDGNSFDFMQGLVRKKLPT